MKAKIGGVEVDGTPEEISQLLWSMGLHQHVKSTSSVRGPEDRDFVPEKVAYRMLKRRPLSDQQRALFTTLRSNHPDWTSATQLQKATKYNPNQLAGLLGALGKRVASTEGFVRGSTLLDYKWDYDGEEYLYRLPETVKAAVERFGL